MPNLSVFDADAYLQKVGLSDEDLRQTLMQYVGVGIEGVHPLYLALGADVVLQAHQQGIVLSANDFTDLPKLVNPAHELIERLLKYVGRDIRYAIHALSACRAFDFDLYCQLGEAMAFTATRSAFDLIVGFSFVIRSEKGGGIWYRLHDLLRRLDDELEYGQNQEAHEILEQHYRETGEIAEAIYHANRLDWKRGVQEWVKIFNGALGLSHYDQCIVLLEVRRELLVRDPFFLGNISQLEGQYFAQLARHAEAKQEYEEAIAFYDTVLSRAPDSINALNNKGLALQRLGNLQSGLSQHESALGSYARAIASFDAALSRAPEDIYALNNKGNALQRLGNLQIVVSQKQDALQNFQAALGLFERTLQLEPNNQPLRNQIEQLQVQLDKLSELC